MPSRRLSRRTVLLQEIVAGYPFQHQKNRVEETG